MAEKKIDPKDDDIHPFSRRFLFLGEKKTKENFIWIPVAGLVLTICIGFFYPHDPKHAAPWDIWNLGFSWKSFPSWAIIGFLAYSFVVLSAEPLFKLLSRDESYYGEGNDDD